MRGAGMLGSPAPSVSGCSTTIAREPKPRRRFKSDWEDPTAAVPTDAVARSAAAVWVAGLRRNSAVTAKSLAFESEAGTARRSSALVRPFREGPRSVSDVLLRASSDAPPPLGRALHPRGATAPD